MKRSSFRLRTAVLMGCGSLFVACSGGDAAAPAQGGGPPPPVVGVLRIEPQRISSDADLTGQLNARDSVVVHSEVDGVVASIDFEEGTAVTKGQVLFRLRDDEARARLHEAEADQRLARDRYRRARDLAQQKIVAESALTDASATLAAATARTEVARVALERTEIRAPFDGMAGPRLVSVGARIATDRDLVKVESIRALELLFTVPEIALPLVRTGVPIELSVAPYPEALFPGEISFVAPSLDDASRRLLVKARVPNEDMRLRPGLFAKVHARIGERENALLVPDDAIVYGSEGSFVWRVDAQGAVQPVPVALAARQSGKVEVASGLQAGDTVVVSGTNKLSPGIVIEGIPAAVASAPTGGTSLPGASK